MTPNTAKETLGSYTCPQLYPDDAPVPFPSAPTDIDPQSRVGHCPTCGNLDIDCLCEVGQ